MNKLIEKTCGDCGIIYWTRNYASKRCPQCQAKKGRKATEYKKITCVKRRRKKPSKSIYEIMRDLAAYNREHNTYLSYGQYVQMIEGGQADE